MKPHRRLHSRRRQSGIVTVVAALLLALGVVFVIMQTLQTAGTRSVDTARQLDSTAALMLAESGLQRAQYAIVSQQVTMTSDVCTAFANIGPFTLGRGTFSYGVADVSPAGCTYTGTACTSCTIRVTGTVGSTSRTLNLVMNLGQQNGVAGRGTTVNMVLKNTYPDVAAIALFNLAAQRQSPGGNASASVCPTCTNDWNVESSSGNTSVGGMGIQVPVAANSPTRLITQTISEARDYAEVGALFPSFSFITPPTAIGSYWDDANGANNTTTINNSGANPNTGQVKSGVATTTPATCDASPGTPPSHGSQQSCTSWCTGGDTLVFGVAGRSGGVTDQVNTVTFNTASATGWPAQNIAMNPLVHFPAQDAVLSQASGTLFSEVWWAYNRQYPVTQATSYASVAYGRVGGTPVVSIVKNATALTVSTASGTICVGDKIQASPKGSGFDLDSTVTAVPGGGTCSTLTGAANAYTVNPKSGADLTAASATVSSTNLFVTAGQPLSHGALSTGTAQLASGTSVSIASGPDASGNYTLGAATTASPQYFGQTNSGTIYVASGNAPPTTDTLVSVYSGTGQLPAGTKPSSTGANWFAIAAAPAVPLLGTICGGTCAMFSNPASTTSMTEFKVDRTVGTTQWSGGFLCLSGVDASRIRQVRSGDASAKSWSEPIQ